MSLSSTSISRRHKAAEEIGDISGPSLLPFQRTLLPTLLDSRRMCSSAHHHDELEMWPKCRCLTTGYHGSLPNFRCVGCRGNGTHCIPLFSPEGVPVSSPDQLSVGSNGLRIQRLPRRATRCNSRHLSCTYIFCCFSEVLCETSHHEGVCA